MFFYLIFLVQVIFISRVVPQMVQSKMMEFSDKYPAENYPKLYQGTTQEYQQKIDAYLLQNKIIFICGLCVAIIGFSFSYLKGIAVPLLLPVLFFLVQLYPEMKLQSWAKQSLKWMRIQNKTAKKSATVKPRRLFDFVSRVVVSCAIALLFCCLCLIYLNYGLQKSGMIVMTIVLAFNLYAVFSVYNCLYGKKLNPYQVYEDRVKDMTLLVKKYIFLSMVVNVIVGVTIFLKMYQMEFLEVSIVSVFLQAMIYGTSWRGIKNINFDEMDLHLYQEESFSPTA